MTATLPLRDWNDQQPSWFAIVMLVAAILWACWLSGGH
jgi:hypothetical protein